MTTLLTCRSLSVHFGGVHALDGLDLEVRLGERVAIVGANGSGKSTLINLCSGIVQPTGGTIHLDNEVVKRHSPEEFSRLGVGRTFQNLRLMEELSVFDNVALGLSPRLRTIIGVPVASRRRVRAEVETACGEVGLEVSLWQVVSKLSYGQRKRVELARLLIGHTRLMLLDEPTAGVSRIDTPALAASLRLLAGPDRTLIVVEHDLDLVAAFADRVVCVDGGKVVADGSFDEVFSQQMVRTAVLGESDNQC
jgi:branched-chain amino acid transport system ATP-binding protein